MTSPADQVFQASYFTMPDNMPIARGKEPLDLFAYEVLDLRAGMLDPILLVEPKGFLQLIARGTEPMTLAVGDVEVLRITPVERGSGIGELPSKRLVDVLRDQHGVEDEGEILPFLGIPEQVTAAIARVTRHLDGLTPLQERRGVRDALLAMAHDVGRAYGLSHAQNVGLTHHPVGAGRLLLTPCSLGRHESERQKRVAEEQRALAAERDAAQKRANAPNTKTAAELEIDLVYVLGPDVDGKDRLPPVLAFAPGAVYAEPDGKRWIAWRSIPGRPLPKFELGPFGCPGGSHVLPIPVSALAAISHPTRSEIVKFIFGAIDKFGPKPYRGPVEPIDVPDIERAKEIIARYMPLAFIGNSGGIGLQWARRWIVEALVRGMRIDVALVAALVWRACWDAHVKMHPPMRVPRRLEDNFMTPMPMGDAGGRKWPGCRPENLVDDPDYVVPRPAASTWQRSDIDAACIQAAARGDISPGALIEPVRATTFKKGQIK